jgi:hypothetical protein
MPGGLVQVAQASTKRGGAVQAPGPGLSELAVDERQHLAAALTQTRADQPRRRPTDVSQRGH